MDQTIQALGRLLLQALPTFFLVLLLHFYLKYTLFRPLEKILGERYRATEGAKQAAEESLRLAAEKVKQYEAALRDARSEMYREQEEYRRQWRAEQAARVLEARGRADELVRQAREQLARDSEGARAALHAESRVLAAQIADSLLRGRAA